MLHGLSAQRSTQEASGIIHRDTCYIAGRGKTLSSESIPYFTYTHPINLPASPSCQALFFYYEPFYDIERFFDEAFNNHYGSQSDLRNQVQRRALTELLGQSNRGWTSMRMHTIT
ncbi:hypothetical protein BD779DRAFT_1190587 [Infundibulicybe gibba]|nr:hypothetical protein BD779DRAFT_1190587 [Infundibulicybe gibba]